MILGLDVGDARIGVAIASPIARIARPLTVLRNDETVVHEILQIMQAQKVEKIVIGLPRNQAGEETAQSEKVRQFAETLGKETSIEMVFADESLSSVRAEQVTLPKGRSPKDPLDDIAACFILEEFFVRREQ